MDQREAEQQAMLKWCDTNIRPKLYDAFKQLLLRLKINAHPSQPTQVGCQAEDKAQASLPPVVVAAASVIFSFTSKGFPTIQTLNNSFALQPSPYWCHHIPSACNTIMPRKIPMRFLKNENLIRCFKNLLLLLWIKLNLSGHFCAVNCHIFGQFDRR